MTTSDANNFINNHAISQTQVTRLPLGTFDFVIHYAEMLNEQTAEFRHSHAYMELFYIRDGELTIRFDEEELAMSRGDLMIIPAQTPHHVLNIPGESKSYFVMIFELKPVKSNHAKQTADFREMHELSLILERLPQDKCTYCASKWDAGAILDQICEEHCEKRFGWTIYTNILYYSFFLNAIRRVVSVENERVETDDALNLAIEATKYIHAYYAENISLETLAAYLYISPRHANRMFRKMFNTTFGKTLRTLRLTYAKTMLATTDLSVDDVAERVGLGSAQALRKLFKQTEGITISQYRKL